MPQARKATKRSAAKRSTAKTPQVNRMTDSPAADETKPDDPNKLPEDDGQERNVSSYAPLAYEPQRQELEHAGYDHEAAYADRQAELAAAREEHNRRTGDASR